MAAGKSGCLRSGVEKLPEQREQCSKWRRSGMNKAVKALDSNQKPLELPFVGADLDKIFDFRGSCRESCTSALDVASSGSPTLVVHRHG
jgi:hypothetical protein